MEQTKKPERKRKLYYSVLAMGLCAICLAALGQFSHTFSPWVFYPLVCCFLALMGASIASIWKNLK